MLKAGASSLSIILQIIVSVMSPVSKVAMSKKILIVSDDVPLLSRVEQVLAVQNYQIFTTVNGVDALIGVVNHQPDLIIADMSMAEMEVYQFCWLVKQNIEFRAIPLVILAKTVGFSERGVAESLGVIHHLIKPFQDGELLRVARRYSEL